mgnify:CR=1 FL=1
MRARPRPGEADRPGAGRGRAGPRRPGVRAQGPARAAWRQLGGAAAARMKTVLVCAAQAPFITGRRRDPGLRSCRHNLERRGFRVDVANVPFKWYPVSGDRAPGPGLAPARRDREQRHAGGPRDPDQVPELPGAPPAQGGVALPPAPRGLRPLRHALLLVHATRPRTARCARRSRRMDTARARRSAATIFTISRNVADRLARYNGLPGTPLYPPPHHLGRYRCDELRRLPLLRRPARPPEAAGPGRSTRCKRVQQRRAAEDRGHGPLEAKLRKQIRGPGRRGPRGARSASSPPTTCSASTPAAAPPTTRPSTRTTAT